MERTLSTDEGHEIYITREDDILKVTIVGPEAGGPTMHLDLSISESSELIAAIANTVWDSTLEELRGKGRGGGIA